METKCIASGKTIFKTQEEAENRILSLKYKFHCLKKINHYKHRFQKPKQKRVYKCPDCRGYHLTSKDRSMVKSRIWNNQNSFSIIRIDPAAIATSLFTSIGKA